MTDKEIIKALECCSKFPQKCKECPLLIPGGCGIINKYELALDLINRQKAEIEDLIERLKEYNSFPCFTKDTQFVSVSRKADGQFTADKMIQIEVDKIRVEAIKEFAVLFKQQMRDCANAEFDGIKYYLIGEEFVNRLEKEMTDVASSELTTEQKYKRMYYQKNKERYKEYYKKRKKALIRKAESEAKELTEGSNES